MIHKRIREVRKNLPRKTTQEAFGKVLGSSRDAIANIELGRVTPSDTFIKLLCTHFSINEHWLRTGEGSMEAPNQTATVVDLLQRSFESLDDYDKQVIAAWIEATPEERTAIKQFFDRLKSLQSSEAAQAEHSTTIAIRPTANDDHVTREEAHQMLDRQFDDKEKGTISSASTGINGLVG